MVISNKLFANFMTLCTKKTAAVMYIRVYVYVKYVT